MFPLYDDNPTEIFPVFTLGLIAACVAVWFYVQGAGLSEPALVGSVCGWGLVPAELTGAAPTGRQVCPAGGASWAGLVTSMFLHGSWMHLIGNMWFLWIFGNNIEDSMGHLRFLLFYLVTGLVAGGAHVLAAPASGIPTVGASGAISAIMGAYLVLYPRARVFTLFIIIILIRVVPLPAWVLLGYWFLIQVLSSSAQAGSGVEGGIAFWAHIGGFVAGVVLVKLFENRQLVAAKRQHVRLPRSSIRHRGWW